VIDQQMSLLDPTFFLPGQLPEHFAEVLAQFLTASFFGTSE